MKKILSINEFANQCGYFYNAYLQDDITANNGYNCNHPDVSETHEDTESGKEIGCCHAFACPLAYEADEEDFNDSNIDNNGWTECEEGGTSQRQRHYVGFVRIKGVQDGKVE